MVLADGQSVAEGLAKGKMLSDQIREQGQRHYEFQEKQIRENGAAWLKEEEEEIKRSMEAQMKDMKKGWWWLGGGNKGGGGDRSEPLTMQYAGHDVGEHPDNVLEKFSETSRHDGPPFS